MTEELLTEENQATPEEQTADTSYISLLAKVIEAILFASERPVSAKELIAYCKGAAETDPEHELAQTLKKIKELDIQNAIVLLQSIYADSERSFEIKENASGWQLVTRPDFAPWLRQLFPENRPARLSAPAMETLAIIAYRQPITKADIEAVRGVAVDGVMQTLVERGLVKIAGRAEIAGRPLLYETTQHFMEHFGLKDLNELPNAAELRRIELPKANISEEQLEHKDTTEKSSDGNENSPEVKAPTDKEEETH